MILREDSDNPSLGPNSSSWDFLTRYQFLICSNPFTPLKLFPFFFPSETHTRTLKISSLVRPELSMPFHCYQQDLTIWTENRKPHSDIELPVWHPSLMSHAHLFRSMLKRISITPLPKPDRFPIFPSSAHGNTIFWQSSSGPGWERSLTYVSLRPCPVHQQSLSILVSKRILHWFVVNHLHSQPHTTIPHGLQLLFPHWIIS